MSYSTEQNDSSHQQTRFSFQHFDQESDFGIETSTGERIRKKKKPGRKPNPPSTQERRAQNRAAQKAFRIREQHKREEREQRWQEYNDEITRLRNLLAVTAFENKYLKGCVLHLILSFLIHRGSVPHIWTESRIIPSNNHGEYKEPIFAPYGQNIANEKYQIPALLDMILDKHHIVDFDQALFNTSKCNTFTSSKKKKGHTVDHDYAKFEEYINKDSLTLNRACQEAKSIFPPKRKDNTSKDKASDTLLPGTIPSTMQQQGTIPQSLHTPPSSGLTTSTSSPQAQADIPSYSNSEANQHTCSSPDSDHLSSSYQALMVQHKPLRGVIFEPPPFCTSEDLATMPTLQALHILRLQMKLGSILGDLTLATLLPTALQRVVPHDIRIDYVPGASIRDKMIIFQDYYDIDECFQYLTQKTVFLGGDVRNARNWAASPEYSTKFWFLSHMVVDEAILSIG